MSNRPTVCPDCQQNPAVHHDGSGWFCDECKRYVARITAVIELNSAERKLKQGHAKDTRRRNYKVWYHKNKQRLKAYHNAYCKFYGRGLRDQGLRAAMASEGIAMGKPRT